MDIISISIGKKLVSGFEDEYVYPEINIVKTLPVLSVVQSVKGSYRIRLDNGEPAETGEGGVFIAPANMMQYINEFPGEDGKMTAQWVFFEVEINKMYKLDELFSFPLILPHKYDREINDLICKARREKDLPGSMPYLSEIVRILIGNASDKNIDSDQAYLIRNYMESNYEKDIDPKEICNILGCSRSAMYPRFRELMGDTPARYLTKLRISHSMEMLYNTDLSVGEIARKVGIKDQFYFARVFRNITGLSASEYRKQNKNVQRFS
ncbi:MAG: helix-turn-helix transcriptional regulator [Clostridia bacterium]|nr:helix-turn-helix transcriptional regulator [Clostridia bacterium]